MLRRPASLPDSLVGLLPHTRRALCLRFDDRPEPTRKTRAPDGVQQDRVEDGTEAVVLLLVECAVAESNGTCARVAGELVSRRLGQVTAPVDPVHDLERSILGRLDVRDELHELV